MERKRQPKDPKETFEITDFLGRGTYGIVKKGVHKISKKECAIKMISYETNIEDVKKEISILKVCENMFVVKYYGSYVEESNKMLWIIIEYCVASCFEFFSVIPESYPEEIISYILAGAVLGLEYLHGNKRIHRDIKAANILFTEEGGIKLSIFVFFSPADLGVSAQLTQEEKRQTFIGTPYWMAPEILKNESYDYSVDIWSLGITAIELCEKKPPFMEKFTTLAAMHIANSQFVPPTLRSSYYSEKLKDFISLCLVREPTKRASLQDLKEHELVKDKISVLLSSNNRSPIVKEFIDNNIEKIKLNRKLQEQGIKVEKQVKDVPDLFECNIEDYFSVVILSSQVSITKTFCSEI